MRILFTVANLSSQKGGPSRCIPQLAEALTELGIEVAIKTHDPWIDRPRLRGVTVWSAPLDRAIEEFQPDLVHDHGLWLASNRKSALLSLRAGLPLVVSPHGMLMPWSLSQGKWKKRLAWWLYQRHLLFRASAVHATAKEEAEQLRQLGFPGPIILAPNGIEFPPQVEESSSSDGPRRALFLSRIHPKKGLPMLIEAWADLRPPGWQLEIVGPGDPRLIEDLRELVRARTLNGVVSFRDEMGDDEKWSALASASLFILPSYSENFGIVVAEALSVGTPVVTTKGTPWSALLDKRCGWWVEPTVLELRRALKDATESSPERLRDMGARGVPWMRDEYSWPTIAQRMVSDYHRIIDGPAPKKTVPSPGTV